MSTRREALAVERRLYSELLGRPSLKAARRLRAVRWVLGLECGRMNSIGLRCGLRLGHGGRCVLGRIAADWRPSDADYEALRAL